MCVCVSVCVCVHEGIYFILYYDFACFYKFALLYMKHSCDLVNMKSLVKY